MSGFIFFIGLASITFWLLVRAKVDDGRDLSIEKARKELLDQMMSEQGYLGSPPVPEGRDVKVDKVGKKSPSNTSNESLSGASFYIVYKDSRGQKSERRITLRKVSAKGSDIRLNAFCHERQAIRSFYASRIIEMSDMATGEVFDDAIGEFQNMIGANPIESKVKKYGIYKELDSIQLEINALVYMARADGRMVKSERASIISYIMSRLPGFSGRGDELDKVIARHYPDKILAQEALSEVLTLKNDVKIAIYKAMDSVMHADGNVKSEELSMLKTYREALMETMPELSVAAA